MNKLTNINIKNDFRQIAIEKYLVTLILALLLGACVLGFSLKELLFATIGTVVAGTCFYSIRCALYLLIITTIVVPTEGGLLYTAGIEVASKNIKICEIIYGLILSSWGFQILFRRLKMPEFKSNLLMYLLFTYVMVTSLKDLLTNNQPQNLFLGARHLSYYGIYFVVISTIKDLKEAKRLYNVILIGSLISALLTISMYCWKSHPLWQFIIWEGANRASFRTTIALIFGLALLLTRWFISPSKRERLFCIFAFFPLLFALIMSQWRAGWISFFMYVILLFIFLVRKHELRTNRAILSLMASVPILVIMLMVLNIGFGPGGSTGLNILSRRIKTFENLETDSSLTYRYAKVKNEIPKIARNPIFGVGYSEYYYEDKMKEEAPVDESHTPVLRMMGIIGYALFALIFIRFWINTLYIYRYSKDYVSKEFSITFLSLFPIMIFLTFTCRYLITYDFAFTLAILMALAELMARKKGDCPMQITSFV